MNVSELAKGVAEATSSNEADAKKAITAVFDQIAAAAVRLMLDKLADHDVAEIYEVTSGQGPIADLAAEAMRARNIDI